MTNRLSREIEAGEDFFHAKIDQELPALLDALRGKDAETTLLEERPRRDACFREQPVDLPGSRGCLNGCEKAHRHAHALMGGVDEHHIEMAVRLQVAEPNGFPIEDSEPGRPAESAGRPRGAPVALSSIPIARKRWTGRTQERS